MIFESLHIYRAVFAAAALTLPQQHVANSRVHVVVDGVAAVDHQTVNELHGLGSLTSQLTGHDHLTTLSAALHDEPQDAITRSETGGDTIRAFQTRTRTFPT